MKFSKQNFDFKCLIISIINIVIKTIGATIPKSTHKLINTLCGLISNDVPAPAPKKNIFASEVTKVIVLASKLSLSQPSDPGISVIPKMDNRFVSKMLSNTAMHSRKKLYLQVRNVSILGYMSDRKQRGMRIKNKLIILKGVRFVLIQINMVSNTSIIISATIGANEPFRNRKYPKIIYKSPYMQCSNVDLDLWKKLNTIMVSMAAT